MVEEDQEGKRRTKPTERGTPQGGVISPLLANIYLRSFTAGCDMHGIKRTCVFNSYRDARWDEGDG